jgi:hypothetical protein
MEEHAEGHELGAHLPRVKQTEVDRPTHDIEVIGSKKMSRRKFIKLLGATATISSMSPGLLVVPRSPVVPEPKHKSNDAEPTRTLERRFNTITEINDYIAKKEAEFGWNKHTDKESGRFGEGFVEQRARLRTSNRERTVGFVISEGLVNDLKEKGEDCISILKRHIEYLNGLYISAGVDLQYAITDIIIIPDEVLGSHNEINHIEKDGIVLNGGKIIYPRYQDSTWVLSRDCNDEQFPNYADKLINLFEDRIDLGLIHELIHHVGIGDFYVSQREFGPNNTPPIIRFLPDHSGYMGGGIYNKISPWEAFYLRKFLENGTFSPQHDGHDVTKITNIDGELEYYLGILPHEFEFDIHDIARIKNDCPDIDSIYISTERVDQNGYHFLEGDSYDRIGNVIVFKDFKNKIEQSNTDDKGTPNLVVLKSNSSSGVWIPIDRHLLTMYYLAQKGGRYRPHIFINSELPEIQSDCEVGLDVVLGTKSVPNTFNGNPVYAHSQINEDLMAIWWVKKSD